MESAPEECILCGSSTRKLLIEKDSWQLPYHLYYFTPESLEMLLDIFELRIEKRKTYHSEVIKNKLRKIHLPQLLARLIARMYSGTSLAVVSKRDTHL